MRPSYWPLLVASALPWPPSAGELEVDTGSVLRFNTLCAHCHEGECSGRLTFTSGPTAALEHMRRYAGPMDSSTAPQLYALLEHMKRDCAYAPLVVPPGPMPWSASTLDTYREPFKGGYFIALGPLSRGWHRLGLDLEAPTRLRLEVINEGFEPLADECFGPEHASLSLGFEVEEPGLHYLRLRGADGLRPERLDLTAERR